MQVRWLRSVAAESARLAIYVCIEMVKRHLHPWFSVNLITKYRFVTLGPRGAPFRLGAL